LNFQVEDEPNKICDQDRESIKRNVVELMLSSPERYQKQLSEAISIVGSFFFVFSFWQNNFIQ